MTTLTAPAPQASIAGNNGDKPINLFQLGCLFVIKSSYWSCRIGNEPQDFHLSPHEVESKGNRLVRFEGADRPAQGPQGLSADRKEGPPPASEVLEAVPRGQRSLRALGSCCRT